MEKYIITPIKNSENEGGRTLMERNSPMELTEEKVIIKDNLVEKKIESAQVIDKSQKFKKIKIKKNRGEKRQFPDKLDSLKKTKRKKKEEKLSDSDQNNKDSNNADILVIEEVLAAHPESQCTKLLMKKVSLAAGNDSDVENGERIVKQKPSRKSKAIASICKDTLDVLSKFDLDILNLLERSLKIIKSHNLLDNKYMSVDILIDLITLALDKSRVPDVESEKQLSDIITKFASSSCSTTKRSKTRESITTFSPGNKLDVQEESPAAPPLLNEEILNKSQEEATEKNEENAIEKVSEKSQEPTLEKSGKNFCITNYFKKLTKTVEEKDTKERFLCFTTKTDMFLAPKVGTQLTGVRREKFEKAFSAQSYDLPRLTQLFAKPKRNNTSSANVSHDHEGPKGVENCEETRPLELEDHSALEKDASETTKPDPPRKRIALTRVDEPKINVVEPVCRAKAKLLQFHDNRRPPYWGTWRRKSETVRPRRPFGKDKIFNYEVDSDDEWEEEEEEPGESLHGSDDDREPEEDYEVDNDFFVPHGYLSDDENPEKENVSSKRKLRVYEEPFTAEQKQKMRKMTPIVFGAFWVHKGPPCEGTLYHDLQVEKLQYVPWTSLPVEIEEEPTHTVKKSKKKIFPNEEIPHLIKMIHGSPHTSDHLARKFLLYRETEKISDDSRPSLTKICVQKKIKELAAWQQGGEKGKMCWLVPKEKRQEFGAEVATRTPEKKPPKCFIWKFVRKANKSPGPISPSIPPPPLEPEVIIFNS